MENSRPFVIKQRKGNSLLPPDCEDFNDQVEDRIRFLQSSNIFIMCALSYQSIRFFYYFLHYRQKCFTYAILCLVIIAGNLLWVFSSIIGYFSINQRSSTAMGRYLCLTGFVLFIRLSTYFLVWALMAGFVSKYYELNNNGNIRLLQETIGDQSNTTQDDNTPQISDEERQALICSSLYQGGLMMIQAIIETVFISLLIYYVVQVRAYLRKYEFNQVKKQTKWNLQASVA